MSYSVFNNWNIVPFPTVPCVRQIDFSINDAVGKTQSPFTMQSQFQAWPGGDFWEANVATPAMGYRTAAKWKAFLMALRGQLNVFQLGDPLGAIPQGIPQGASVTDGVHAAMGTLLRTRGWTPNCGMLLMPGDYIQLGYRLYSVAQPTPVNSDADGKATIEIWPSLREAPADGTALTLTHTTGLFRLSENKRDWTIRESKNTAFSFKVIEAR